MIHDPRVLDDEVVPDHELILHRRDEMDALLSALRPRMNARDHVYAFGPTGTGKSTLAKLALTLLEDDGEEFDSTVVNCWKHPTRSDVLRVIAEDLVGIPVNRHSTPTAELTSRLTDDPDRPRIVVLDEADQLADTDVLYDLHQAPALSVLYLGNDEDDLFAGMADRVRSRVSTGRRIDFDCYSTQELAEILQARADHAFRPGAVSTRQLEAIASAADGDARTAIRSLRLASEAATENGYLRISDANVEEAIPDAREELRQKSLSQLTAEQRLVYDIVRDYGPISPADLYERYEDRVEDSKTKRTVRSYLSKMRHYNLVEHHGSRNDRSYTSISR
ncbi:orc1/cdc6 family replication initiation protein [Haloferax mucosum ATCC BAA-1512]|uniref:Orc1/cdc6 family replication initiation protein n=1 Tax=Haloferax mucosum ATCC BAA-1512 TaxID=662479 RepID=M0IGZ1_9EURY|nr:Cdc6/Cdc18 family protein [Haloferax mucosum]ELZ96030.1 orc1/cdc6 family replication initiation protein [Haloferax mucosum ATCC BAA-1512]